MRMRTLHRIDWVKWIIWGSIILGSGWAFFFVPEGPQYLFNGIRYGGILMLGAIGLSLTYKILNFANFAHGDLIVLGAFSAYQVDAFLYSGLPHWFPALAGVEQDVMVRWMALAAGLLVVVVIPHARM